MRSWHTNTPRAAGKRSEGFDGLHEVVAVDDVGLAHLVQARGHADSAGLQLVGQRSPGRGVDRDVVPARVQAESQVASDDFRSGAPRECDVSEEDP